VEATGSGTEAKYLRSSYYAELSCIFLFPKYVKYPNIQNTSNYDDDLFDLFETKPFANSL